MHHHGPTMLGRRFESADWRSGTLPLPAGGFNCFNQSKQHFSSLVILGRPETTSQFKAQTRGAVLKQGTQQKPAVVPVVVPDGFNLSLANLISANVHCGSG